MNLRRTTTTLAACAVAALAAAAPASADSIVYVKDGNVWLTSADGAKGYQVTFDGGYDSPSQADSGMIVALHDKRLVRLDRSGRQIGDAVAGIGSPGPGGGDAFYGPYEPRVSPDGTKIAYWFGQYSQYFSSPCNCYLFHRESHTTWSYADHFTDPSGESGYAKGITQPEWLTNDRLLATYSGFSQNIWTYKIGQGTGANDATAGAAQFWFGLHVPDDYGYFDLGDPALSPDGTKLAVTDDGDANTNTRVWLAAVNGPAWVGEPPYDNNYLEDSKVPAPDFKCQAQVGNVLNPTWSPDSRSLAFSLDDGVHVWHVGDAIDCAAVTDQVVAPGGAQPDWGPADVDLSQKPSPQQPGPDPHQPGPDPQQPGSDPRPATGLTVNGFKLTPKRFRASQGTTVRFNVSAPAQIVLRVPGVRGRISSAAKPGANTLRFKGRIAGRLLKPGRYTLRLTAQSATDTRKASAKFTVTR